jgi:hypothetical protein
VLLPTGASRPSRRPLLRSLKDPTSVPGVQVAPRPEHGTADSRAGLWLPRPRDELAIGFAIITEEWNVQERTPSDTGRSEDSLRWWLLRGDVLP